MPVDLNERIAELHNRISDPSNNNALFVGQFVLNLVEDSVTIPEVEEALREIGSRVFLVALPLTEAEREQYDLFLLDTPELGTPDLEYSLWIGMNGQAEALERLEQHGITPQQNLTNLSKAGFLASKDRSTVEQAVLDAPPLELHALIKWLLLDAETWEGRRDKIREQLELLTSDECFRILDEAILKAQGNVEILRHLNSLRQILLTARNEGLQAAFANSETMVLEAVLALLEAPTWEQAPIVFYEYEEELSGPLALELIANQSRQPHYTDAHREVLQVHADFIETMRASGQSIAVERALKLLPEKHGAPDREQLLRAYLQVNDLDSAAGMLIQFEDVLLGWFDPELINQIFDTCIIPPDLTERLGLLDEARTRGAHNAYQLWRELAEIGQAELDSPDEVRRAIDRLREIAASAQGRVRDRALEHLLILYDRTDSQVAQLEVAKELLATRSDAARSQLRAHDLVNAGIAYSKIGQMIEAERQFEDATTSIDNLRNPSERALLRFKIGYFYDEFKGEVSQALHYFRWSAEDFGAAGVLLDQANVFLRLAIIYEKLDRPDMSAIYAEIAYDTYQEADPSIPSIFGNAETLCLRIESTLAQAENHPGNSAMAARRLQSALADISPLVDESLVNRTKLLALVTCLQAGDLTAARGFQSAWSKSGQVDYAFIAEALVRLAGAGVIFMADGANGNESWCTAMSVEIHELSDALSRLDHDASKLRSMENTAPVSEVAFALLEALGFSFHGFWDDLLPKRIFGDHEASVWRRKIPQVYKEESVGQHATGSELVPLEPGAPWFEVVERYSHLRVWETPDLAIYGPILDRWVRALTSRTKMRINPVSLSSESLDVFFYRSDPEEHLLPYNNTCVYIRDGEFILCSLPFLESLFGTSERNWSSEHKRIEAGLSHSSFPSEELGPLADRLTATVRARERILIEWILSHELGHFEYRHDIPRDHQEAVRFEKEADDFFIKRLTSEEDTQALGEVILSLFGQLYQLYTLECEIQHRKRPKNRELLLNDLPNKSTGHHPLVFRWLSFIKTILESFPRDLDTSGYVNEFEASIKAQS